jgi:hypothetical protein
MAGKLWQLRHSRESVAFIWRHSFCAMAMRCASNLSLVSILPVKWPNSSPVALTLRTILWPQSFGTWQSEHTARTPVRFWKWTVDWYSAYTLSRISWQVLAQNASVLVASMPACSPTQPSVVTTPPITTSAATE